MIWKTENRYIVLHYSRNKTIIAVLLKERRDDWNVLGEYLSGREKEVKALSTRLGYI